MKQAYGQLIVDLATTQVMQDEIAILQHRNVGGVVLFSRNYQDRQQLEFLVKEIREVANKPLLIMVDHEGGRIWRFVEGFQRIPAAASFGKLYENDPMFAVKQTETAATTIASELLSCGIDLTLAPVLDLDTGNSAVIGDRAFHAKPHVVTELGRAFIAGLTAAGMAAVGKHFPGHGHCSADTHYEVGKDERSYAEIVKQDLVPFVELHNLLAGIMPAHVIYPAVDDKPAGFSKIWLQDILRDKIGYTGTIISDCLAMKGASVAGNFVSAVNAALTAGCDLVLLTQQSQKVVLEVLAGIDWSHKFEQQARISKLAASKN